MRAVVISRPGGPEVLTWQEVPDPVPGPGEVLVAVAASAVNRADLLQREGHYDPPPGSSPYPGLECSGRITEPGRGGRGLGGGRRGRCPALRRRVRRAGDASRSGSCCRCRRASTWCTPPRCPRSPAPCGRTSSCWRGCGRARPCWCTAAARASGRWPSSSAARWAPGWPSRPGRPSKLERCRELGAEVLVNYRDQDFVEAVRAATDGHGADVVLDNMGAKYLARNLDVLATSGRLSVIGMQGGTRAELDLGLLMRKRGAVFSTSLRARPADEKAAIVASTREHVWPLLESGDVRPVVDRVLPMADAAEAHRVVEQSSHVGKRALLTRPPTHPRSAPPGRPRSTLADARQRARVCRGRPRLYVALRGSVGPLALGPGVDLEHRAHPDRLVEPQRAGDVGDVDVQQHRAPAGSRCARAKQSRSSAVPTPRPRAAGSTPRVRTYPASSSCSNCRVLVSSPTGVAVELGQVDVPASPRRGPGVGPASSRRRSARCRSARGRTPPRSRAPPGGRPPR